jgi:hypothetical protein
MLGWYDECKIRASRNDPVNKAEREEYTREYKAAIANHKRHDRHPIREYCYCLDEFKRNRFVLVVELSEEKLHQEKDPYNCQLD